MRWFVELWVRLTPRDSRIFVVLSNVQAGRYVCMYVCMYICIYIYIYMYVSTYNHPGVGRTRET